MGKALNQSISTFYGLHHEKGKSYTFEHFKKELESKGQTSFDQKNQGKSTKFEHGTYYQDVWKFEGKNSQSRWIWIEKPQLIHRYVICTILKCILVRKLKYSRKYNSSPIFLHHTTMDQF